MNTWIDQPGTRHKEIPPTSTVVHCEPVSRKPSKKLSLSAVQHDETSPDHHREAFILHLFCTSLPRSYGRLHQPGVVLSTLRGGRIASLRPWHIAHRKAPTYDSSILWHCLTRASSVHDTSSMDGQSSSPGSQDLAPTLLADWKRALVLSLPK